MKGTAALLVVTDGLDPTGFPERLKGAKAQGPSQTAQCRLLLAGLGSEATNKEIISDMEYRCESKSCPYEGDNAYTLYLPQEACIDEHNCAVVFCPHCKGQMVIKSRGDEPVSDR
jgi:hypothetical protein